VLGNSRQLLYRSFLSLRGRVKIKKAPYQLRSCAARVFLGFLDMALVHIPQPHSRNGSAAGLMGVATVSVSITENARRTSVALHHAVPSNIKGFFADGEDEPVVVLVWLFASRRFIASQGEEPPIFILVLP